MTISALPPVPQRTDLPADFVTKADNFVAALPLLRDEINTEVAGINAIAIGGAYALPYTFSTTTTDADPGNGFLRLNSATQNTSTVIRLDLLGSSGTTYTSIIDTFDDSTSVIKGQLKLTKLGDNSKWLLFNVTALANPSGYKNLTVTVVASSAQNPFADNDGLMLQFQRTGDKGDVGLTGTIARRVATATTAASPTPDAATTDLFLLTAQASSASFQTPTGAPLDGQGLLVRVKDNGTARLLSFSSGYRASTELALPTTTILGKTLYMGFVYNLADVKWDLVAVLNNI